MSELTMQEWNQATNLPRASKSVQIYAILGDIGCALPTHGIEIVPAVGETIPDPVHPFSIDIELGSHGLGTRQNGVNISADAAEAKGEGEDMIRVPVRDRRGGSSAGA